MNTARLTNEEAKNTLEGLLTVSDIMERLNCSESFVRKLFQRKRLTYVRLSHGAVRVRVQDLERFIEERTTPATERKS